MLRYVAATLGLLAAGTIAQSATVSSAPSSTSDAPQTHTVLVGWAGFKFTPNETHAKPGDTVEFKFYPPDHSVIRADYEHGCIPYEYVGANRVGFYSQPQIMSGISEDNPVFHVKVNDTDPIFFYCGAVGSCMSQHMIGVINPNENQTLAGHLKYVEAAEFELIPGQDWPSEGDKPTISGSSPAPTSTSSPDTSPNDTNQQQSHGLSSGAIAGIAIGGAAVLLGAAGLIYYCGRNGGMERAYRKSMSVQNNGYTGASTVPPSSPFSPGMEHKALTPMSLATSNERWSQVQMGSPPQVQMGSPPQGHGSPPLAHGQMGSPGYGGFVVPNVTGTTQVSYEAPSQEAPVELPATTGENRANRFSWQQGNEGGFQARH